MDCSDLARRHCVPAYIGVVRTALQARGVLLNWLIRHAMLAAVEVVPATAVFGILFV